MIFGIIDFVILYIKLFNVFSNDKMKRLIGVYDSNYTTHLYINTHVMYIGVSLLCLRSYAYE